MEERTGWRGQNESQTGGEEKRNGRLYGAAETSKERAEWRRLQRKNWNILGLPKSKEWPQCHRESSWQERRSRPCQKEKEQSRLSSLSRLRCSGHSLLLGSCLSRIGRIENPSCSACGHSSQDTSHLILHCPATNSLRRSLFGDSLSLYDLWSRPWGVARLLGLHGLPPCPHPSEGVG